MNEQSRDDAAQSEIERAKMAFFANVSQEFRTPLALMLGPIEDELAEREQPLPPGRYARLETARRNGLRLLRMVNALLDFSQIDAGHKQAAFEPVDLVAVTQDLADGFRAAIDKAGLRLNLRLEPLPEPVCVDREMWAKIVLNLLSNALKHTFKGGITLTLLASDEDTGWVELRVDDTGTGIPQRELPKLFQLFHRIKGARARSHEGAGIGLALVRTLAELHGGKVGAVSREGLGSSFRVSLRRGSTHLPPDRLVAGSRAAARDTEQISGYVEEALGWSRQELNAPQAQFAGGGLEDADGAPAAGPRARLLLADANNDMRSYLARLLGHSHQVRAAADGESALQAALAEPPDLIVADVALPGRDGFELLKALRAAEATRLIPVILLSASAGEDAALAGLEAGADDYLVKPFSGKALLARVRSCLELARQRKESADKLSEANRALAAAAQAKSAFLATMSHEIRTPMNAVIGMAGLLSDTVLTEEQREYASIIRSSGEHLLTIINDVLDFSKLESGKLAIEHVPCDLVELIEESLDVIAVKTREKGIELIYEVIGDVPGRVLADPGRVRQVLLNFLSNAAKFTNDGEIVVSVSAGPVRDNRREIHIAVRDSGIGIPADRMDRLFGSFSQVDDSTARRYGGTGLGLVISRRLAELMGGRAWAESEAAKGSTFHFTFLAELPDLTSQRVVPSVGPKPLAGLRVWIVDDNDTNRRILRKQVEGWGMLARDTALPEQALRWAAQKDPCDLALLDFNMPGMDGVELARRLHGYYGKSLPQVLLSSGGRHLAREEALQLSLHAQLTKPVKSSMLYNTLLGLFTRRRANLPQPAAAAPGAAPPGERHPLRILVAEDNAVNLKLITILLNRLGYKADVAGNGKEACEAVRRQPYDLILMDVQMPEMDGIEATRYICREFGPAVRPRIVALTAGVLPEERQACLDAGMDECLNKPVVREQLVDALQRCQRREDPPALPSGEGFDIEAVTRLLQEYTIDDVRDLVRAFLQDSARLVGEMRAALGQGDATGLGRAVHRIKAPCQVLGAAGLARACTELELLAKGGDLATAAAKFAQVQALLAEASQALAAMGLA